ncbi:MAG: bifunctional D-glycero-beta-D-manno-heptose-7-phosphate kinase/D-glycero-beta-D-manno-heptose 1-phosphate adenylyltransferase HldE [Desulfobacteraceae bacterium]|nr:bifunctional D-glycero-beta-D-manno-heptose-7-phosphate kinase/D-glycero-beta-D-manno-heptose 1-phosphate adenylyltransferase HldE [Desulfobacteraceae bacterium]
MMHRIDSLRKVRILVAGDVMLDRYTWGDVARISPEAPVPVLRVREHSEGAGGAANVALNLAGLGCEVTLVGFTGTDPAGATLQKILRESGVGTELVPIPGRPTITKTRVMAREQQILRIDEEEVSPPPEDARERVLSLLDGLIPGRQAVILSDYGKGVLLDPAIPQRAIDLGRKRGIPVLVDPKGKDWERYRGATCVTPNVGELESVSGVVESGEAGIAEAAGRLRSDLRLDWLLVTRGKHGMCLVGDSAPLFIPTRAREVFDVSGAGDTVIATLAAGLAAGFDMNEAAKIANVAAGIVVGKLGTQPVTFGDLEAALQMGLDGEAVSPHGKVLTVSMALTRVKGWRSSNLRVVFTNGCFDLLHPGHIHLLHQARALGDRLVVGLNTDASVRRLKGELRPILAENDRATLLAALSSVDAVVLFDEDTPLDLIEKLQPEILVKGDDYRIDQVVGRDVVERYGGRVELVKVLEGRSTTTIIDRISHQDG